MGRRSKSKKVQGENSPSPAMQDGVNDENSQDVIPDDLTENEILKKENENLEKENENLKKDKSNLEEDNENLKKENKRLLEQVASLQQVKLLDDQFLKKEKHIKQGENIGSKTQEHDMEIVDDHGVANNRPLNKIEKNPGSQWDEACADVSTTDWAEEAEDSKEIVDDYGVAHNKPLNKIEKIPGSQWEGACADVYKTDWAASSNWPSEAEDSKANIGWSEKSSTYSKYHDHSHRGKRPDASGYDRSMPRNKFQQKPSYGEKSTFDESRKRVQNEQDNFKSKEYQNSRFDERKNRGPVYNYPRNEGRKPYVHDSNRSYNTYSNLNEGHNQRGKTFNNDRRRDTHSRYDTELKHESMRLKLFEIKGDLFEASNDNSLAHCVAADLRMGSGIAVQFKQKFKRIDELLDQKKKTGEVAVLEDNGRFIYYLVTKKFSTGKPRISDLQSSLFEMRVHMEENRVMNVAIPRIGCGLDRLHWKEVRELLLHVFSDLDVTITVYDFTIDHSADTSKKSSLYTTYKLMKLVDIEQGTLLISFGSESGDVDSSMKELDEKYRFINDYKEHSRSIGDVIKLHKRNEILCILIVKKDSSNVISYSALMDCVLKMRKIFKEEQYSYMGLTAFMDKNDDLTVAKIITLFKVLFANLRSELWICWPPELKNVYEEYYAQNG